MLSKGIGRGQEWRVVSLVVRGGLTGDDDGSTEGEEVGQLGYPMP